MRAYNNIIYGDININIDLCAVKQADLLSFGMQGHVEVAGVLIEYHSLDANRHTLATDQAHSDQQIKGTKRLTCLDSVPLQALTENYCRYGGVHQRFF